MNISKVPALYQETHTSEMTMSYSLTNMKAANAPLDVPQSTTPRSDWPV